jgi:hypothetical protein
LYHIDCCVANFTGQLCCQNDNGATTPCPRLYRHLVY